MTQSEWESLFPFHIGPRDTHLASLRLVGHGDPQRREIEAFVHERFERVHHADVHQFLPELLSLRDRHGTLVAAAGIRLAAHEPLFLERYLDEPLESPVARVAGYPVARQELVEVGNLAARSAGSARLIIAATTWLLAARGLRWVAFTGAATLINSFHRLGLEPTVLGPADPARLNGEKADWGSYYDQHPQVFAGSIRYGHERLELSGTYERLGFPVLLYHARRDHAA
ncbi:thermostable hemolysin [Pseudomonas sp. ZM23]|uniref:Thermostable hemolysin n=1 Tax=Pseudomonas triclosanedens TaxID=2961893 RepID=A0ABY6ZTL5_9PSED|nr:thermostable hemolysin [Pseudomonas triclosanedens]MCP8466991.1 thermostable hemolysin [Pseudomonas triclosanedens]MCP8472861.1 thermostable hemolysin [Pseudomonas triclosanedens]MCP8478292.1 thermostable hemolysin [Pseudomonas triclosanedens]WAI47696.1 thermostable hemolysin [Pseudomonas triclosanedens]